MRSRVAAVLTSLTMIIGCFALVTDLPATASATTGSSAFNTLRKAGSTDRPTVQSQLWRVRVGNEGVFDRIVFDERYALSSYSVRYVNKVVADPSGRVVSVKGHSYLLVVFQETTTSARPGYPAKVASATTPNLGEVLQIKKVGEFEAVVSFAIGLREHRGFRVLQLTNPRRIIIVVLH